MSSEHTILVRIAQSTRLREGPEGVRRVLQTVFRKGPISSKTLARESFLPIPVAVAVRNELQKQGLVVKIPSGTILSPKGLQLTKEELNFKTKVDARCSLCNGLGLVLPDDLEQAYRSFTEICEKRPAPRTELDQARATSFTAFSRALQMHEDGNLDGRRICFLGDGDLVSVAVRLLGNPQEVVVIDIDEELVKHILSTTENYDIEISAQRLDLKDPLPSHLLSRFDVFSTDPPYSLQGALLFLLRGLQLLKRKRGMVGYLSARLSEFEMMHALQNFLLSLNCVFREIRRNFNKYEGAEIIGSRSDFYLIETGPAFQDTALNEITVDQNASIYTGVIRRTIRIYQCRSCGALYNVGMNQPHQTIEELKDAGCSTSSCRNKTFILKERKEYPRSAIDGRRIT